MTFKLTPEQSLVVDTNHTTDVVVEARAGTGKTTVLKMFAVVRPDDKMVYLAYNKPVADEAKRTFPPNVTVMTSHALAYRTVGYQYRHKLGGNLNLRTVSGILNTRDWKLAGWVRDTLTSFMASDAKELDVSALPAAFVEPGKDDKTLLLRGRGKEILDATKTIWRKMQDVKDPSVQMIHDGYLKLFYIQGHQFECDWILFDEAQDANPVTQAIVASQKAKVVWVGDPHQQIYRFRGAYDALSSEKLANLPRFYLTHSFRFGTEIAEMANVFLSLKNEQVGVVGVGDSGSVGAAWPEIKYEQKSTYICRTIAGVIDVAYTMSKSFGQKIAFVGGIDKYDLGELEDFYYFVKGQRNKIRSHNQSQYSKFADIDQYKSVAYSTEEPDMMRNLHLFKKYHNLPLVVATLKASALKNESAADVLVTTAHRCKGLEWDCVVTHDDFPDVIEMIDSGEKSVDHIKDEINLMYVTVTRALSDLKLSVPFLSAVKRTYAMC